MRRAWILGVALAVLTGCAFVPGVGASVQTYLPTGGFDLNVSSETQLSSLDTVFTVSSTAEGYFLLVNILVSNASNADCTLRVRLHNVSGGIADQSNTSPVKAGASNLAIQVPYLTTGQAFGLGSQTLQVFVTKTCGSAFGLGDGSYLAVFNSQVPGGAIVSLGVGGSPQTNAQQFLAVDGTGSDFGWSSATGTHTLHVPSASATARGVVTTGTQTIAGVKTFSSGIVSPRSGVAQTTQIGNAATATAVGDVAIGEGASATGGGGGAPAIAIGADSLANSQGVGIGAALSVSGVKGVGVGDSFSLGGDHAVAIGQGSFAGADAVALGYQANCASAGAVCIGSTHAVPIAVYFGDGESSATPQAVTLSPMQASGSNITGAALTFRSRGTGNHDGGILHFQRCVAGSSGSTPNSCSDNWVMKPDGSLMPGALGHELAFSNLPIFGAHVEQLWISDETNDHGEMYFDGTDVGLTAENTTPGKRIRLRSGVTFDKGTRYTPSATQTITAVGTAITLPTGGAAVKFIDANNSYTLTSAPTIADGTDGDCIKLMNVDSTDVITIQDQGTLASSNLRLTANTLAIGPRDSVRICWYSVIGDWVQDGALVNVL